MAVQAPPPIPGAAVTACSELHHELELGTPCPWEGGLDGISDPGRLGE